METQQPASAPGSTPTPTAPVEQNKDARLWATFAHLSATLGMLGVPFGNVIGPLVIWLLKKEEHPFIEEQGREALNFQISMLIYSIAGGTAAVVMFMTMILAPVGFLILLGLYVFDLVQIIMASIKANGGEAYRYPLSIRIIQ